VKLKMALIGGHFFQQRKRRSDRRLLVCSDLRLWSINRQTAIDMADDKSDSHQHHRSGDASQDEADKSQTRTIRHVDALISFLPDKTRDRAKGSIRAELICPLRNQCEDLRK
jgi:hypothetical protein